MDPQSFNSLTPSRTSASESIFAEIVDAEPIRMEGTATVAEAAEAFWLAMRKRVVSTIVYTWLVAAVLLVIYVFYFDYLREVNRNRLEGGIVAFMLVNGLFNFALWRSAGIQAAACDKYRVFPCEPQTWTISASGLKLQTATANSTIAWEAHHRFLVSPRLLLLMEPGNVRVRILCKSFCETNGDWERLLALVAKNVPQ